MELTASDKAALAARYASVRAAVAAACRAAGRSPDDVTLLAVSKTHPHQAVRELYGLGQRDFGENLIQAWRDRLEAIEEPVRWHVIGPIQTNKVKFVTRGRPALVHTIDRPRLVDEFVKRLTGVDADSAPLDVLLEVNVDDEPQKAGVAPADADALADAVVASGVLRLRGLMCIPRPPDTGAPREAFAALRELSERLADRIEGRPELSMGMSADFAEAIAEGATIVRVGSAIFGPRGT